jgi:hypothetical protein
MEIGYRAPLSVGDNAFTKIELVDNYDRLLLTFKGTTIKIVPIDGTSILRIMPIGGGLRPSMSLRKPNTFKYRAAAEDGSTTSLRSINLTPFLEVTEDTKDFKFSSKKEDLD